MPILCQHLALLSIWKVFDYPDLMSVYYSLCRYVSDYLAYGLFWVGGLFGPCGK